MADNTKENNDNIKFSYNNKEFEPYNNVKNLKRMQSESTDVVVNDLYGRIRVAQPKSIDPTEPITKGSEQIKIVDPDERFNDLNEMCSYLDENDLKTLKKAYEFAKEAHKDQKRKSGEAFVVHPVEVAIILSDLHMDIDCLCAALLHDTVEDTTTSSKTLIEEFN